MQPPEEPVNRTGSLSRNMSRAKNALRAVDDVIQSRRQMVKARILVPASCNSTDTKWLLSMLDQKHSDARTTLAQARLSAMDAYNALPPAEKDAFVSREGPDLHRCLNLPLPHGEVVHGDIIHTRNLLYRTRDAWWREFNYRCAKDLVPSWILESEPMIRDRIRHHDRLVDTWIEDRRRKEWDTESAFSAMSLFHQDVFRTFYRDLIMLVQMDL